MPEEETIELGAGSSAVQSEPRRGFGLLAWGFSPTLSCSEPNGQEAEGLRVEGKRRVPEAEPVGLKERSPAGLPLVVGGWVHWRLPV